MGSGICGYPIIILYTTILQVFIAAFRKRKLSLPENLMEMHDGTGTRVEFMERTPDFR